MSDDLDNKDKNEIDEFLDKFDKISNVFDKSLNRLEQHNQLEKEFNQKSSEDPNEPSAGLQDTKSGKTRLERLSESKPQNMLTSKLGSFKKDEFRSAAAAGDDERGSSPNSEEPMTKHKKKKKYTINKKRLFKFIALIFATLCVVLGGIVVSIIVTTEPIEPDNIYSRLTENSVLYDDEGNIIDSLLTSDGLRTNVSYTDLPQDLVDAFIAIEDKTFWEHNGFNVIRILGAIKEGVMEGDEISGTSTITQQLARNVYLAETKSHRTLTRKIREAYYTVLLERHLTKKQILEAYLNTIFLGYGTNGVQAAPRRTSPRTCRSSPSWNALP
jgi:penicillin-binding protein 1A